MTSITAEFRITFMETLRRWIGAVLSLLFLSISAAAQSTSPTDGMTPAALSPGAPAGTYGLSGFDNVNLYNGNLNFTLPLLGVGGRGSAQMTVTLKIDSVRWKVDKETIEGFESYSPNPNWWEGIKPGYGPGVLQGRRDCFVSPITNRCTMALTRLTFTAPDGTEYELRDQLYGGQPKQASQGGISRGTVFISSDSSAATFLSDADIVDPWSGPDLIYPTGHLLLRDGTRYRIINGLVQWLRDRNGNKMTFDYDAYSRVTTITDSLNRRVTVTYANLTTVFYDQILFKGFGGAQRTIKVWHTSLGQALRPGSGYSVQTYEQLFGIGGNAPYNPNDVISEVELPDGRRYRLFYNPYGELARVDLPTGGAIQYDYTPGSGVLMYLDDMHIHRRLTERRVYADVTTLESKQVYSATYNAPGSAKPWFTTTTVEQRDASGTLLTRSAHSFYGSPTASLFEFALPTSYSPWKEAREYQTEAFNSNGTTVLRRVTHSWQQRAAVSWWTGAVDEAPSNDQRITETITTLVDTNQVAKQTFGYDDSVPFNNQNNLKEYDLGNGAPGALLRETRTTFKTDSGYTGTNVHIRNLVLQVSIFDGGGTERSRSAFEYDNYVLDGPDCAHSFHCPLLSRSNISGFDSTFGPSYATRGNITASTRYLLSNGTVTGSVSAYSQYDITGNVVRSIDARSTSTNIIATTIEYDDHFGAPDGEARGHSVPGELTGLSTYALPTKVINALDQKAYAQYDYYLGKAIDGEDMNGVVASGYFNDVLDRPTQVIRDANNLAARSQINFTYDDTNHIVTTKSDISAYNDNLLRTETLYDSLGRTIEMRTYENATQYITVKQIPFVVLQDPDSGSWVAATQSSNPYRSYLGEQPVWTTTFSDALGRTSKVRTPDNSIARTSYSGNAVTVTDQVGKVRRSITDGLGRLSRVDEPDANGNLGPVSAPNQPTSYAYDVLDNLTTVSQGVQTRTFVYDSLKRLTSASNPESGTISYQYDNNGNLLVKTDARNVSTHYSYDALNRPVRRWYNGSSSLTATVHNNPALPAGVGASAEALYLYDSQTLPTGAPTFDRGFSTGKLVAITYGTGSSEGNYFGYDALGRPLRRTQQTGSVNYQVSAVYNLAGGVTSQTYPSGRTVSYTYDNAGRLSSFTGTLGDGVNRNYSTEIIYSSLGGMAKEKFGTDTPLYKKTFYNSRGQMSEIRVGTTYTGPTDGGWQRGAIINHYSAQCWGACNGTDNDGNLKQQDHWIPDSSGGLQAVIVQGYTYDSLNRLQRVQEGSWQQEFVYDRWGNRTIHQTNTWGTGINKKDFTVNTANNRLGVPAGQSGVMTYDNAGNLTNDTYTGAGSRVCDAENRMTKAWGGNNQWQEYSYNADGQRVRRKIDGIETWQIYGMDGELLAEYVASAAPSSPQKEYGYRNGQLLITAEPAAQVTIYQASTNFSSTQGQNNWYYLDSGGAQMSYISANSWWRGGETYNLLWASGGHPGNIMDAMRQWRAPAAGTVRITGSASDADPGGGDGVVVTIKKNSSVLWQQTIANGNTTGFSYDLTTTVVAGDQINFLINRNGNNSWDSTNFNPTITFTAGSGGAGGVQWLVVDQLGTPRMIFDQTGSLAATKRHDYLPFGEELFAGVGGRTTALGYTGSTIRQKFTGYERDGETGLDFAQARYHSSSLGRFTSPDPFGGSMRPADPQSFNRYSYVENHPLTRTDPSGLASGGPVGGLLPGANGAMGRVRPGECPPTEWKGNPSQHWIMASGGVSAAEAAPIVIVEGEVLAGFEEIGSAIAPQDPVPAPPPTPTPMSGPCTGRSSKDLNYDRKFRREDGSFESGKDHIMRRHILLDDGNTILTPSKLPLRNQSAGKFIFQENVSTQEQAWQSLIAANAYVFDGAVAGNKGYIDQGRVVISGFIYPQIQISGSLLHIKMGVGYIRGRTMFGPSNTLTLILDKNCRDVITAFAGPPYNRR